MKILFYMTIVSATLLASGFTTKENKEIVLNQAFTKISLQGNLKVILVQGNGNNTISYKNGKITAEVNNGELVVKQKNGLFSDSQPFVVIPVQDLAALKIKDDAAVFTQGIIKTNELTINQRGDGIIKLSVDANKIFVQSNGNGKIQIEGNYQQTAMQKTTSGIMLMEYVANKK